MGSDPAGLAPALVLSVTHTPFPAAPLRPVSPWSGGAAIAAKRIALVVGNASFPAVGTLANPVSDATAVAAALQKLDFEVDLATDLNAHGFRDKLKFISGKATKAEISVVYDACHGVECDGTNDLRA